MVRERGKGWGEPLKGATELGPLGNEGGELWMGGAEVVDGGAAKAVAWPLDGGNCSGGAVESRPLVHGVACGG